jgi:hypothetical protein
LEQEAFREQNREQKILVEVTASHQQTTHLVETDLLAANANDEAKSITIALLAGSTRLLSSSLVLDSPKANKNAAR